MTEHMRWLPVVGFPDYEVSEAGVVRRCRPDSFGRITGQPLMQSLVKGYYQVTLFNGTRKMMKVHTLVLEAFVGPRPTPTHQAAHNDGDALRNHYTNLRWATPKENCGDKVLHGTHLDGVRCHKAVLNPETVREIRHQLATTTCTQQSLADRFGVTQASIYAIKHRISWRNVA